MVRRGERRVRRNQGFNQMMRRRILIVVGKHGSAGPQEGTLRPQERAALLDQAGSRQKPYFRRRHATEDVDGLAVADRPGGLVRARVAADVVVVGGSGGGVGRKGGGVGPVVVIREVVLVVRLEGHAPVRPHLFVRLHWSARRRRNSIILLTDFYLALILFLW